MTATTPARAGGSARARTRGAAPARDRTTSVGSERAQRAQPDRLGRGQESAVRSRSVAAERAYARRAGRGPSSRPPSTERRSGSASRVSFVILVMSLLVVGVVATLLLSTQSTADSYQLAKVQKNTQNLAVRVQQLQQEVAQARSPEQLAKLAAQLGMVPADNLAHLVVGPNGQVTVVGTPSAATAPPPPPPPTTTTTTTTPPTSASTQPTAGG